MSDNLQKPIKVPSSNSSGLGLLNHASIDVDSPNVNGIKRNRRMRSVQGANHYDNGHQDKKVYAKHDGVPIFVKKTYEMINTTDDALASWSSDGVLFVIKDPNVFGKTVIPKFFDHNNFASFARQLNFYGFRKLQSGTIYKEDSEKENAKHVTFYHEMFQRGKPHLLINIIRSTNPGKKQNQKDMQSEISELKSVVASLQSTVILMQNQIQQLTYQQQNQMMTAPSNEEIDTRSTYYHPTNSKDEKFPRVAAPRLNSLESKFLNDILVASLTEQKQKIVQSINSNLNGDISRAINSKYEDIQPVSAPRLDSNNSTNSNSSFSVTDVLSLSTLQHPSSLKMALTSRGESDFILDGLLINKGNYDGIEPADKKVFERQEVFTGTAHYDPNGGIPKKIDSISAPRANTNTFVNSNFSSLSQIPPLVADRQISKKFDKMGLCDGNKSKP